MIVIQLPPNNEPVIFASSLSGLISIIKVGNPALAFGAHNDPVD
jgi:hypothetical protein